MSPEDVGPLQTAYEGQVRALNLIIEKRERALAILSRVAARVHGEEDVRRILDIALDAILEEMQLRAAWIFLGDERDQTLHLAAHRGVAQSYLDEIRTRGLGKCLCPEVFWTGHRMQARNTTDCPRMPHIVEGLQESVGHACIPLKLEGGSRGVLNVAAESGRPFAEDDLRFLETLGHQVCIAVERARHLQTERNAHAALQATQVRLIQQEKMAVMGTFASGLAHEIRNPLNSIGLQLMLLERRIATLDGGTAQQTRDTIAIIRSEIRRLDALVNDFLLLSRTNRMTFQLTDLDALADEVTRFLAPETDAARVSLERLRIGEASPQAQADPEKIKQVMINLLRNAVEAMPSGGSITLETGVVDGRACLKISDTGPGLPADVDVFQLFASTKPGGTGLGLPIAQQIVLDHGGEITAGTEPGHGAVFTILLPIAAPVVVGEKSES